MKKILLSCVTCLLALGLVTACDTEEDEKASGGDDSTTQESDTTTGDTTEAVTLTNYTVSFSLFDKSGEAVVLEEDTTLYIIGDWDSWANFLPCTEEEGVYSYTFATITTGTYEYKGVTYDGEDTVSWENCTEVILDEDGTSNAKLVVSESDGGGQVIETTIVETPTIVTRKDVKVTWYFVDSASTPNTYHSIPNYADAYVTGYFVGTTWTNYEIGGSTKLVSDESNGYTVTFSEINVGTVTYNMYFEYNSSATNHTAATAASWNSDHAIASDSTANTTMIIPEEGDVVVYLELDPSTIITDEANFCEMTLALKNSTSTAPTSTIYYKGSSDGWQNEVSFTNITGENSYDYYVTFSVDQGSSVECGIYSNSTWGDSLQVAQNETSGIYNNSNNIVIPATLTQEATTLIIFTCDLSAFTGSGTSHVTASSISVSHPTVSK